MSIDKELVKQILGAQKARHCLYVPGARSVLQVSRSKPSSDDIAAAKAAGKSSTALTGRVLLEKTAEEQKLVFFFPKPDKSLEPKLKNCVKEHAGLRYEVEVRALSALKASDEDGEDGAPAQGGPAPDGAQAAPPDPLKAAYEALAGGLKGELAALAAANPDLAAKLLPKFAEATQNVPAGTSYKDAVKALGKLRELFDKGVGKATDDQKAIAEKAAYKNLRDALAADVQKLRVLNPAAADKVRTSITEAEALVAESLPEAKRDYKAGLKKLRALQEFVGKGLAKLGDPKDAASKETVNKARAAPKQYETLYRESRRIVKELLAQYPDSAPIQALADRVAAAAGFARVYDFDQAVPAVQAVHGDLQKVHEGRRQYLKKQATADAVLSDVEAARGPAFPQRRVQHLRDYRRSAETLAQSLRFDTAAGGIVALEDEARLALSERSTYLEAYLETAKLLHEAEGRFPDEKFDAWEAFFLTSTDLFEADGGSATQAYDIVTTIGAEVRKALRDVEVKKDAGTRVEAMTKGTTREARRLRYKLELDGVRKALPVIAGHDEETAAKLGAALAKVTEAQKKSLTKAEALLAPLVQQVNAALAAARQAMEAGDWDHPDDEARKPPPPTLKEWSDGIERDGVLGKVKVGKKLAAGGFGAIYRLGPDDQHQDEDLPPLVVKLPLRDDEDSVAASLEDFRKEAAIYEQIGDHPNILKCLGVRKVGDAEGLVMEAVRGKTTDAFFSDLRARAAEGELDEAEFWSTIQYTMRKTMSALAHLHQAGLAHNDIKPQNIMIDEVTGDVKVIDVGTANRQGDVVEGVENPVFQAPEQLKKEGSSGQTDVLPAGGVAYSAVTGEGFHFGNAKGMMAAYMTAIEDTMLAYGDRRGDDAEDAAIAVAPEDEVVRTVNERGEDDPKGRIQRRDPGKASARSAYTEFINAVMHPDPSKRLSAEQALNHPFLRDAMLSEEQVRAVIQSAPKDKVPPGEEPEREQLQMFGDKVREWGRSVESVRETNAIEPWNVAADQLLAGRERAARSLDTLDASRLGLQRYIDVLTKLTHDARQKDGPVYFKDNQDLATLKKIARDLDKLRPDAVRVLRAFNVSIERSREPVGDEVTADQVAERIRALGQQATALDAEINTVVGSPAPALFDQCRLLDRLLERIETVQANTAIERQILFRIAQRKPPPPEVKKVAQQLTEHLKTLAPLVARVRQARDDGREAVEEAGRKVSAELVPKVDALLDTFRTGRTAHRKAAKDYQAVVKAPRDTADEMIAFEKARNDFEAEEDRYRRSLADLRRELTQLQAQVLAAQRALGTKSVSGASNPLKSLSGLYKKLGVLKGKLVL